MTSLYLPAARGGRFFLPILAFMVLGAIAGGATAADSFEPNDEPNQAHVVTTSGVPLESWISSNGDVDWYRFQHSQNGTVRIDLQSLPADYDLVAYFLDPGTSQLVEVGTSENPDTQDESLQGDVIAGDYFIEIYGWDGANDPNDSYLLTVTFSGGSTNTPPQVTLTQPNGGETYAPGSSQDILFSIVDPDPGEQLQITIEYSSNGGSTWSGLVDGTGAPGSYSQQWTVPATPTTQGRIRVTANDGEASASDMSNGNFTISAPAGDNDLVVGSTSGQVGSTVTVPIQLTNEDVVRGVQADVTFNPAIVSFAGVDAVERAAAFSDSSRTISSGTARIVLFPTTNATIPAGNGRIANLSFQIVGTGQSTIALTNAILSGTSGQSLQVQVQPGTVTGTGGGGPPSVTVLSPNGGETLAAGAVTAVTYTATGGTGTLQIAIDYSTNGGTSWNAVATGLSNSGSFSWTVPAVSTTAGRVRVTASDGTSSASDASNGNFTISNEPPGANTVSVASASGASGATVDVALSLANEDVVKGLQLDLTFDAAVASFVSAAPTGRGAGMEVGFSAVSSGRVRGVLYFDDAATLAAGSGPIATLRFQLRGGQGGQTSLAPSALVLSDPGAGSLEVSGQAGVLDVTSGPDGAPTVQLAVLRNPGRERSLRIHVHVENGSGSAPTVTVDGAAVAMEAGAGGLFSGTFHVPQSDSSVVVEASDTNGVGTSTDRKTIGF